MKQRELCWSPAEEFNCRGFQACFLLGEHSQEERAQVVSNLQDETHPLQVVCSVDVFGEGVDIPTLTHVLMLRPTQSFTVFLQQLGRGLRRLPEKDFLVVLDFIGNFRNSYVAPLTLRGFTDPAEYKRQGRPKAFELPSECTVQTDKEVTRIWEDEIKRVLKPSNRKERLTDTYRELRSNLDHSPGVMDFFANPEACDPHEFVKTFGNWLRAKEFMEDLATDERQILGTSGEAFLQHIENELNPVKSYKMVVLLTLLNTAPSQTEWTVAEIAEGFKNHYLTHSAQMWDYPDMARSTDPRDFPLKKVEAKISEMPLHHLSNDENKFFVFDPENGTFSLKPEVHPFWKDDAFRQMVIDRVLYGLKRYFHRKKADLSKYRFDPRDILEKQQPVTEEQAEPRQPAPQETPAAPDTGTDEEEGWELIPAEEAAGTEFETALPLVADLAAGRPYDGFTSRNLSADTWVRVPRQYVKQNNFVVRVAGDSMEPTMAEGDYVICEWHRTPRRNGQIVVMGDFEPGGESGDFSLKRFTDSEDYWYFHSDNPDAEDPPPISKIDQPAHPILGIARYNLTKQTRIG